MLPDYFELVHNEGKLFAVITFRGETFEMDVTDYFENNNPHDDWLDYKLKLKIKNQPIW
jgi:hypothetical protein